jgi:hypothetical protein
LLCSEIQKRKKNEELILLLKPEGFLTLPVRPEKKSTRKEIVSLGKGKQSTFSPAELLALHNTKFFSVKASATEKIQHLLCAIRDSIKTEIKNRNIIFSAEVDSTNGKISRGENYLGLPYLVLDYPKYFSAKSIYACRTLFWWGNFFSFTVHLQGRALEKWREGFHHAIALKQGTLRSVASIEKKENPSVKPERTVYICVNETPWHYHYGKDNYLPIAKLSGTELSELLLKKEFVKLSICIPLEDHKELIRFATESFLQLCPATGKIEYLFP